MNTVKKLVEKISQGIKDLLPDLNLLSMNQTDLGNRMAVLMITARVGDRSLPLTWLVEEGAAIAKAV